MPFRGRHWVIFWLLLFLGVAAIVLARQTSAIQSAGRLATLREERAALEAQRAAVQREIRLSLSRQSLGRHAESSLGLHQPADSEYVLFAVPRAR